MTRQKTIGIAGGILIDGVGDFEHVVTTAKVLIREGYDVVYQIKMLGGE